jgi:hypothetical protein
MGPKSKERADEPKNKNLTFWEDGENEWIKNILIEEEMIGSGKSFCAYFWYYTGIIFCYEYMSYEFPKYGKPELNIELYSFGISYSLPLPCRLYCVYIIQYITIV